MEGFAGVGAEGGANGVVDAFCGRGRGGGSGDGEVAGLDVGVLMRFAEG